MKWLQLIALALTTGCAVETTALAPKGACEPVGGTWAGVSFSDEQANNALDFVDHASIDALLAVRGLDADAVRGLVAQRPFAGRADPLGDMVAVAGLSSKSLTVLREGTYGAWCATAPGASCCLDLGCEGAGGPIAHTRLDDADAFAVLEWANDASLEELERVCGIGPVTASAIVRARPLHNLRELERVEQLGPHQWAQLLGDDLGACTEQASVFTEWCGLAGTCECR